MKKPGHVLFRPRFPRSNNYDPDWVMENQMGPNVLWLAEWLTNALKLKPGMRVLDLGCGKALSSIFLAQEFKVQVWAADLWVHPDENWPRVRKANMEDRVFPLQTEAHALPFARDFFDAIVSFDAYQYFGTDDLYLHYLSRFVKPAGKIGAALAGLTHPFKNNQVPSHLTRKQKNGACFWEDECACFHTAKWWSALWRRSNCVEKVAADTLPGGWRHWRDFEIALEKSGKNIFPSVAEAVDEDRGRYLGFIRLVGTRKNKKAGVNLYDPSIIARMNIEHD